jgi:uncharacterized protein (TIGR03435 family)
MKHTDEDINGTLDRLLKKIGDPEADQMEQRIESVAQSLRSADLQFQVQVKPAFNARPRRKLVYAAALIAAITIGGIAAQRSGLLTTPSPKVESSVKPAPALETATVPAAARESKESEPATTPASREALRAAQIAAAQSSDTGAGQLQFAAASVKLVMENGNFLPGMAPPDRIRCRGVDGELFPMPAGTDIDTTPLPQGRCRATNVPLRNLVMTAYASTPLRFVTDRTFDVVLPPGPTPSYQIQATADDPSRATKGELQQMLRTLLADRFKAKVHREIREVDGYVLSIAKTGIKFKETSAPAQNPGLGPAPGFDRAPVDEFGGIFQLITKGNYQIAAIVRLVEGNLLKPVADKTGLSNTYDITLYLGHVRAGRGAPGTIRGEGGTAVRQPEQFIPPLPKAFEDQLGLLLEPTKVPIEVIVVDHIEKPSEN